MLDIIITDLLVPALIVLGVCTGALMVTRKWGFGAGMSMVCLFAAALMITAVHALTQVHFTADQDCRLVGGCTPDVIQSYCAPAPAQCPSVSDYGQVPAKNSPAWRAGER